MYLIDLSLNINVVDSAVKFYHGFLRTKLAYKGDYLDVQSKESRSLVYSATNGVLATSIKALRD
jgi:hypothetical protein